MEFLKVYVAVQIVSHLALLMAYTAIKIFEVTGLQ